MMSGQAADVLLIALILALPIGFGFWIAARRKGRPTRRRTPSFDAGTGIDGATISLAFVATDASASLDSGSDGGGGDGGGDSGC